MCIWLVQNVNEADGHEKVENWIEQMSSFLGDAQNPYNFVLYWLTAPYLLALKEYVKI